MKKGGKRLLCVPSAFGYGTTGSGDRIPPNSALVFVIEVTKHKNKDGKVDTTPATPVVTAGSVLYCIVL